MPTCTTGIGRYSPANHAAGRDVVIAPTRRPAVALPPLVYCHGATEDAWAALGSFGSGHVALLHLFADLGRYVVACDLGASSTNWANSQATTCLTDAVAYAITASGYAGSKVHLLGASMGHALACRWAALNPTKVRSITGVIPAVGVQWCRDNNATLRAQIDAAHGVTYPAALPAGADPFTDAAQVATLAGIPWQGFAASDDTTAAPLANVRAWGAAVGGAVTSLGALGHTDAAIGAVPMPQALRLLYDND
jgi:pimeloyl-ACP methyl ester carboxylesterase